MGKPSDRVKFREGVYVAVIITFILFLFSVLVGFYKEDLSYLGIKPRTLKGVIGIFTAPILHGDLHHLLSNTFPLLFGIPALFYFDYKRAGYILLTIYILSGFWVWLSARDAVHLGASGVVYGLMSYLLFSSLFKKSKSGMALAAIIIFLYGAPLLAGFFPTPGISFEAHISGAVAGLFIAVFLYYLRERDEEDTGGSTTGNASSTSEESVIFKYDYKSSSQDNESKD